ncbi:MAG TPA: hypothetical protein VFB38_04065 [Chthonomonadaceae bacterium]|nr:hypothetical protein [Chthonomonadaceae bacterium]
MEPATITALAVATVKLLAPYLKEMASGAAKKAGKEVGQSATEGALAKAGHVFELVKDKLHGSPAGKEAMEDLTEKPEDADTQASVRAQLKKRLEAEPAFASQLAQLLKEADQAGAGTVFNIQNLGEIGQQIIAETITAPITYNPKA